MKAIDLDEQSEFGALSPLDEKEAGVMNTLGTTARAIGSRVRDAGIATAGHFVGRGHEAQGRLGARVVADNLLKGWLFYKGATKQPQTRENVFDFVRKQYGGAFDDDNELRDIMGLAPVKQSKKQDQAARKKYDAVMQAHIEAIYDAILAKAQMRRKKSTP